MRRHRPRPNLSRLSAGICTIRRPPSATITARSTRRTRARSACRTIPSAMSRSRRRCSSDFAWRKHDFYFDPEIAGGKGFSECRRHRQSAEWRDSARGQRRRPSRISRGFYIQHDFGFGTEKEHVESDENQLAGDRPVTRYSIYAGRFTVTDFFDNNSYTHDPRTQFMAWGVMYNGAWDYPADTRGYTWGIVQELHTRNWAFRYGDRGRAESRQRLAIRPAAVSGSRQTCSKWSGAIRLDKRPGAIRVLEYAESLRMPEIMPKRWRSPRKRTPHRT